MKAYLRRRPGNTYSLVVNNEEYAINCNREIARNILEKPLHRNGLTAHGMIDKEIIVARRRDGFYYQDMQFVEVRDYETEINDLIAMARNAGFAVRVDVPTQTVEWNLGGGAVLNKFEISVCKR